jgi:hypothetical protein
MGNETTKHRKLFGEIDAGKQCSGTPPATKQARDNATTRQRWADAHLAGPCRWWHWPRCCVWHFLFGIVWGCLVACCCAMCVAPYLMRCLHRQGWRSGAARAVGYPETRGRHPKRADAQPALSVGCSSVAVVLVFVPRFLLTH